MRAFVRLRLPDGQVRELGPGDILGRAWSATLQLRDPWVSEAHAMVSLREGVLKLLGLRGKLSVNNQVVTEVVLAAPMQIGLSARTRLEVLEVRVPPTMLVLEHDTLGRFPLTGPVSLRSSPRLELVPGAQQDAEAIFWNDGEAWLVNLRDGASHPLDDGSTVEVAGHTVRITATSARDAGQVTTVDRSSVEAPLHLAVRYDTVHVHREGEPPLVLDGQIARIVSDLATAGVPMGWTVLAADLWPNESDPIVLRRNWDAALARLRKKLREARVRADLVRADRSGNFELFLRRADRVDDQT